MCDTSSTYFASEKKSTGLVQIMWTWLLSWAKNINYSKPYLTVDLHLFSNATATYQNAWCLKSHSSFTKARESSCKHSCCHLTRQLCRKEIRLKKPAPLPLLFHSFLWKEKASLSLLSTHPSFHITVWKEEIGCIELSLPDTKATDDDILSSFSSINKRVP